MRRPTILRKIRLWAATDRAVYIWLNEAGRDYIFITFQRYLRHPYALCGHSDEGAAESDVAHKY